MAEEGSASAARKGPHLTKRELEVLRLMCDRNCYQEKAMPEKLGMTPKTFETHRYNLYKALDVHSRSATPQRGRIDTVTRLSFNRTAGLRELIF